MKKKIKPIQWPHELRGVVDQVNAIPVMGKKRYVLTEEKLLAFIETVKKKNCPPEKLL